MRTDLKTFTYGRLEADSDSWLLVADDVIILDVSQLTNFDGSLEHQIVSVIGTLNFPLNSGKISTLAAEKLESHDAIAKRAYEIFQSGRGGTAADHWLLAERELLAL